MDGHTLQLFDLGGTAGELEYYLLPADAAAPPGRAVLLLHGLGCQARTFDQPQLRRLQCLRRWVVGG